MEDEELPILTKKIDAPVDSRQTTDPTYTSDGLPILKKKLKPESESPSLSSNVSKTPVTPSKKSTEKSSDTSSFIAAIKDMAAAADKPADPTDAVPSPFINAVKRGLNLAEQAGLTGPFADKPDAKAISKIADLQKESQALPGSKEYTEFTQSPTFSDAASKFIKNPVKILAELTGESMASMAKYGAPRIAAGAAIGANIGLAPGAASGAIVGMADTSYGLEFTGKFLESLKEAGIDITDPASLTQAFQDENILAKARSAAQRKAIPIAIFDLVSGGLAGKLVAKPAASILKKIGAGAAELAVQSTMGAAGELAGEVVSGEKIQPGAIMSEALGELGTSPVEIGLGVANIKPPTTQESTVVQPEENATQKIINESETTVEQAPQVDEVKQDKTPKQQASEEIDALVASGDVERKGNSVTIKTEKGGQEVKRIYEELEKKSKDQEVQATEEQPSVEELKPVEEGVEQQRSTTEQSIPETPVTNDIPTTTTEQPSQSIPEPVEQPATGEVKPEKPDQPQAGGKTYAIAERILNSDADTAIKSGVKQKGANYIPKGINITDTEAKNLIELYGHDKSETIVRDQGNGITGDTRTALAARLYESYKQTADQSVDPETKRINYEKAVDIAMTSAEQLKEAGRQTNAAKIWKAITSSEDMTVMAIEKENQRHGSKMLESIYKQVKRSRQQMDSEIERLISKRVEEGVSKRLERTKLITEDQKKKISTALDALKIKDVKGTANDITRVLGAAVWNGSVEAVKHAVLTGADLANAIQAGVEYVRENFKGQWDEQQYKDMLSPAVKNMIPESKINPADIDEAKVETPKISGKKKRDFINQVVDAHNEGKLTDDKFDQLYAKQLGAREFSADDRLKIRELAKTIAEVEQFEEKVKNDFTRENISKYKSLLDRAEKANASLQTYAQKPNNIWDTLISIMQGNLLTPLSLVTNIYSNLALQPLRFLSTGFGSVVDYGVSQIAKTGLLSQSYKDTTIDLTELQKGYFQGGWNGLTEGLEQFKTGAVVNNLRDINNNFSPGRAIGRWADSNRSLAQKINDYVEGTIGWPAETFFRLLNLGDKPFRRAAEMARGLEIAKQKGLSGNEIEKFLMFPDPESADQIKKAGDDATFQQENPASKKVQEVLSGIINWIGDRPYVGGPLKLLAKSQIPYVKTPWNIMVETLKYAAFPITGAVGIHQIAKGNKRSGSVLVGQAIVGAMVFAVAKELFSKGLLSWDEPYKKEGKQRERRQIQYDNIPPNSLNVSAIQRGLIGGGWDIHDDDTWIDYNKLGVIGLLFDNYSNNYFSNIKEDQQMPDQSELYVDMLTTAPRVLSQSLDQSFLKGTNTLLTAIQDGGGYETEQWLINTSGALASIVYPNTLSTVSKSSDQFIRDTRDESFVNQLKNTYKTKFFIGDQLPPKVNLWGDKITGNPEGRDKYAYYLFDPTKFKNVDTDNWKYRLYTAWKDSMFDDDYLPSIPKREITHRKIKINLNAQQYSQLAIAIGEQRKNLVSSYINSASFERKDKEKVIKKLRSLYEEGSDRGKKKFLIDTGWNILTPDALSKINK